MVTIRLIEKLRGYNMLLVLATLLFILGLYFIFIPQQFTYNVSKIVSYNNSTYYVSLGFSSLDGFYAQKPIPVYGKIDISNRDNYKSDVPYLFFKDTSYFNSGGYETVENISGSNVYTNSDFTISPYYLIFPIEDDYEAFLVFDKDHGKSEEMVPLGKVIHISSPESSTLFFTNKIMTGLSLIITGMTIVQIWISLRGLKLNNEPVDKNK